MKPSKEYLIDYIIGIFNYMKFNTDHDWDYIYDLMCDPNLNPFDQIKYSEQISLLKSEMEEYYKEREIVSYKKP
jgi:hypothetical protein